MLLLAFANTSDSAVVNESINREFFVMLFFKLNPRTFDWSFLLECIFYLF
ncbi:hypothetical protein SAMD00023520_01158 [Listeria monocytogenes]|nr:hypothetical protein SAMD00023519_01121 [Listeria monocytogenes]GAT41205.1 hypothetical protein SAMD00023520_01158 [Listeria monocytogenes]